jgi:hypothetical protein
MPATYDKIEARTLGTASNSVTFTSIPATYTDIVAIVAIPASGPVTTALRVNGDTGNNYSTTILAGISAGANSYRESNKSWGVTGGLISGMGANTNIICNFMNYSNTTTNKTILARGNSVPNNDLEQNVILWRNTAAINSISFIDYNGGANTYPVGTTFTLYGIKAA